VKYRHEIGSEMIRIPVAVSGLEIRKWNRMPGGTNRNAGCPFSTSRHAQRTVFGLSAEHQSTRVPGLGWMWS
jgi:hypothetical protein